MMAMRRQLGLTLVEVVVTIAIIIVLAGIVFAVARSSQSRAKATSDMNDLRQIGQAQAIYSGDSSGDDTWDPEIIAANSLIAPELLVSSLDDLADPLVNRWSSQNPEHFKFTGARIPEIPMSYAAHVFVAPGASTLPQFKDGKCAWLANTVTADCASSGQGRDCLIDRTGPITLLFQDGRTVTKQSGPKVESKSGGSSKTWSSLGVFGCEGP